MRCNNLDDQMRAKQPTRFSGQLGPEAKLSSESQGPSTNAVLPGMVAGLNKSHLGAKQGKRLDING